MSYTTESKVESYLMIDIDPSQAAQISNYIDIVEKWIENYTGRKFEEETATKYYDGPGGTELYIDPCLEITSFEILDTDGEVDDTLTEGHANDYLLYPLNETPKYIVKLTTNSCIGAFPVGKRRIKITGKWGQSSTVPKDVELAATMLVGKIIEKGLKGGEASSEGLGDYRITYKKIDEVADSLGVKQILDHYRKIEL
ncbi:MAG: hypothetical protein FE038_02055 [Thermoplasmata archaeon]|nr:MAG: hypothetical protein FE038_02055 [Thermoplasmata archaeon]